MKHNLGSISHTGTSIINPEIENNLGQMYPVELEIKYTIESNTSASYLDLLLSVGRDGQLYTSIYDKRDDFNFQITNFPFLSSNISVLAAYVVFISRLSQLYLAAGHMPGLAPRMDVLFWERRDFQISFSNRDTSRNAWNRHLGSLWSIQGCYQRIWSSSLMKVKELSVTWPYIVVCKKIRKFLSFFNFLASDDLWFWHGTLFLTSDAVQYDTNSRESKWAFIIPG